MKLASSYHLEVSSLAGGQGPDVWRVDFTAPGTYHVESTSNPTAAPCLTLSDVGNGCRSAADTVWTPGIEYHRDCLVTTGECARWRHQDSSPLYFPVAGPGTGYLPIYPLVALDLISDVEPLSTNLEATSFKGYVDHAAGAAAAQLVMFGTGTFGSGVTCTGPTLAIGFDQPSQTNGVEWACATTTTTGSVSSTPRGQLVETKVWLSADERTIDRIDTSVEAATPGEVVPVEYRYSAVDSTTVQVPPID